MKLHSLKPAKGSVKTNKRLGRGQGSGKGGTSTRGHKGQQSRSGHSRRLGFEGGQMPLSRRLPKFGFSNMNRKEYKPINLSTLQELAEKKGISTVSVSTLNEAGLIGKNSLVKILGNGTLKSKIDVSAHAFSKTAKEAIEALGGKVEIIA